MPTFSERVFAIVKQIPEGKVSTYGQIARMMGSPRSARYVGWALRGNKEPVTMPCHRVIFKDGRICEGYAFGGPEVQRKLLEDEGVAFVDDMHVDMDACLWEPDVDRLTLANAHEPASPDADRLAPPADIDWEKEMGL